MSPRQQRRILRAIERDLARDPVLARVAAMFPAPVRTRRSLWSRLRAALLAAFTGMAADPTLRSGSMLPYA